MKERSFQFFSKCGLSFLMLCLSVTTTFAQFEDNILSQSVDNSTVELVTGDDADFFSQTVISNFDGDALQSGSIEDNQLSSLLAAVSGGDLVSFDWRVSSEEGFDGLVFFVLDQNSNFLTDGLSISGETDWQTVSIRIPGAGTRFLFWGYVKDEVVSVGQDAGWVDNLRVNGTGGERSGNAAALVPILNLLLQADEPPVDSIPGESIDPSLPNPAIPSDFDGKYYFSISTIFDDRNTAPLNYVYTQLNSNFSVRNRSSDGIRILVDGAGLVGATLFYRTEDWSWNMFGPRNGSDQGRLSVGIFNNVERFSLDGLVNILNVRGLGQGCNGLSGRFRIFEIEYTGDTVTRLLADFQQRCDGSNQRTVGSVDYDASRDDAIFPKLIIPQGSPTPTLPLLETRGGVLVVEGTDRTFVVGSEGLLLDNSNSTFFTSDFGSISGLSITITTGNIRHVLVLIRPQLDIDPNRNSRLSPGVYPIATGGPSIDPLAGLDFSGNGSGCNRVAGSFTIYEIDFDTSDELTKLLASFEAFCDDDRDSIKGSIHLDFTL